MMAHAAAATMSVAVVFALYMRLVRFLLFDAFLVKTVPTLLAQQYAQPLIARRV